VLFIILLLLAIVAILIYRHNQRHKGEYLTQEDKGADEADADDAVVHSTTGHHVTKKKEWFI
jgi:contactin associated protein-like 2